MQNNVFKFGDMYLKQKQGTDMGMPVAGINATTYYQCHEWITLLNNFCNSIILLKDSSTIWLSSGLEPKQNWRSLSLCYFFVTHLGSIKAKYNHSLSCPYSQNHYHNLMPSCAYSGSLWILLCGFPCLLSLCTLETSGLPCKPILLCPYNWFNAYSMLFHMLLCVTTTFL